MIQKMAANPQNTAMDDMARIPPPHCQKVFVQRDFSEGTGVKFVTKYPQELDGRLERQIFEKTINELNRMYAEAETLGSRNYCESCFACLTAYLAYLCMNTHYEKMLKKIGRYVHEQNEKDFLPRGLMLVDPGERGLRVVEICVFSDIAQR